MIHQITTENAIFDPVQYEKEHLTRLYKSGLKALEENAPQYKPNLKRTIAKWIINNINTTHTEELKKLVELYESI